MRCTNLPSQLSSFIGREREIATANRLLHQTRLLTLTGPGGCGKTRLALAVAERLVRRYPDGAWLVELAPVSDPDLVPQEVAAALDLREAPGRPLTATLAAYLRTRRMLLVLDNCEHLVAACAGLAHALLAACPGLRILATSREALHVTGETTWTVPPLAVPELTALPRPQELDKIAAVRLFVERAGHIRPGFAVTEQNAQAISEICRLLAGSPLAIELAAARTRVLSPEQIAPRLKDVLGFLATSDRTVPARHRTLLATLDWSYNLLSEGEQALFRRLSVFPASFSVQAAEAICTDEGCGEELSPPNPHPDDGGLGGAAVPVLDLLSALVDKSLLEVETGLEATPDAGPDVTPAASGRFRYLEPVRQYAVDKLVRSGDGPAARDRLLAWAVALAEQLGPGVYSRSAKRSVEQLELEHPSLRAALEWGLTQPARAVQRHRLAIELAQFWQVRGYFGEGMDWFRQVIAGLAQVPVPLQIDTLVKAAFIAIHAHDFAATRHYLERGIALSESREDRHALAELYQHLAFLAFNEGDLDEADRLCDLTLPMYEVSGNDWGRAVVVFYRANIEYLRQNYAGAREDTEASLRLCRELGFVPAVARRQVRLGQINLMEGNFPAAKVGIGDGLRMSLETGDNWGAAMSLSAMAGLALHQGRHEHAAWLLGVVQHFRETFGVPFWNLDEIEYERTRAGVRLALGEARFEASAARGAKQAERELHAALKVALDEPRREDPPDRPPARGRSGSQAVPGGDAALSRRELEVAALVAQGKSNAEIAAALFIGLRTVEAHVTHVLNKLGFTSRAQIAAWMAARSTTPQ
jgi:predicted ATPase/DNA-binding CsgD family transcriptional regulator